MRWIDNENQLEDERMLPGNDEKVKTAGLTT